MKTEIIAELVKIASKDDEKNIEVLKRELLRNDYKITSTAARIFLSEMTELGMTEDERLYWETLAVTHLPQYA